MYFPYKINPPSYLSFTFLRSSRFHSMDTIIKWEKLAIVHKNLLAKICSFVIFLNKFEAWEN